MALQKRAKQQKKAKDPKDKRAKLVESQDEAEVRQRQCSWAPRLEVEGAPIPWDAIIWESQKGYPTVLAEALEQPFLFPGTWKASGVLGNLTSSCH